MSWVKRNLYFLIGSTVALVLLGLAGFYFYSNWNLNNTNLDKLNAAYSELDQLAKKEPNPGNKEVDNIEIARQQEAQVRVILQQEQRYFLPIPPIPNPTNNVVTKDEFASALRRTMDDLEHAAETASVLLPPKYSFSFEAERSLTIFARGSLQPLSARLGEVRAICSILYQAKINSLDNLRRERVSGDDVRGPQSDYLAYGSVTNSMAVLTPYEVTFHCFSTELASVLAGFAGDPHGFVVKAINVEPGALPTGADSGSGGAPGYPGVMTAPPPPSSKGGPPVMLDEKQLKVTLAIDLIKLLPRR
ncbi:MAG: hypothetical protein ABSA69_07215 [Verrucomicrobiota bacterium]|jgi:hypothetical protein